MSGVTVAARRSATRVNRPLGDDAMAAARGGTALIVFHSLARVLSLVFVAVVTRRLGPDEFGRFSVVSAIVVFANLLADFGTSTAITRRVSRSPAEADDLLSGTLTASFALGVGAYVGAVGFALVVYPARTVVDVAIGGLAIPGASVLSSVLGALDGAGMLARRSLLNGLQTLIVSLGGVAVLLGAGVRVPIALLAAAPMMVLVVACLTARRAALWRSGLRFDGATVRSLLRTALPFAVTGGLWAVTLRFDVLLLSVLRSPAETAAYDVAVRLIEATGYLCFAICGPMLFILNRRIAGGDHEGAARAYREGARVLYLLGAPLSVALVVLARPIVSTAIGAEFQGASVPFALLGAGLWLSFVISLQGAVTMASEHLLPGVCAAVLSAVVTVVLDVLLISRSGATGAAVAMLASWGFTAVVFDVLHTRTSRMATPRPPVRIVIAAGMAGGVLFALRGLPVAVAALAGGAIYLGALAVLREVTVRDLSRLRALLAKRLD